MLILLLVLFLLPKSKAAVEKASAPLLLNMPLLFIPAVMGVVHYWQNIKTHWLGLFLAIVVSTIMSLGLSAKFSEWLMKKRSSHTTLKTSEDTTPDD